MASKRIAKELAELRREQDLGRALGCSDMLIAVRLVQEDELFLWTAALRGPPDTPYEHGEYHLDIVFPPDYPFKPPKITFRTPILHPNITLTGAICIDILNSQWSPALTAYKVLVSIGSLIYNPCFDDPLRASLARMHRLDAEHYDAIVRQHTQRHAIPDAPLHELSLFEHAALALESLKYVPEGLYDRINDLRLLNSMNPLRIKRWRYPAQQQQAPQPGLAENEDGAHGGGQGGLDEPDADVELEDEGPTLRRHRTPQPRAVSTMY